MSESTRELFEAFAKVLLRCWILGFVLLLVWFGLYLAGVYHGIHGEMFGLSKHELDVVHYSGMALFKLFVFVFFFFPWLAVKLVLRNEKG